MKSKQVLLAILLLRGVGLWSPAVPASAQTDGCGDLDYSGTIDPADLVIMSDYLFAAGPAPDSLLLANFDGRGGVNFNDYVAMLYAYVQFQGCHLINCTACRGTIEDYPVNSAETVYVRNHAIPAGETKHVVELWANRAFDNVALAFPFSYSCTTGPVTIDSIVFNSNLARDEIQIAYESFTNHAFLAYHRALGGYGQTGKYRIASIYFRVDALGSEQQIVLDTATWFGEETFLSWSGPGGQLLQSMRPVLYGTTSTPARPPSCCVGETGDLNGDGNRTISDLTIMINFLFVTFEPLPCPAAGNTFGDEKCYLNLTDVTRLVYRLFVTFQPTDYCNQFDNFICGQFN